MALGAKNNCGIHDCKFKDLQQSNVCYPLDPNANAFRKLARWIKLQFLISSAHVNTKLYYRSEAAVEYERKQHSLSKYNYVIHPFSTLRLFWESVMVLYYSITFLYHPLRMSYGACIVTGTVVSSSFFIDSFGFFDVFFNFITGYYDRRNAAVELKPKIIATRYLKTYFVIDFVTSVPFSINEPMGFQCFHKRIWAGVYLIKFLRFKSFLNYLQTSSKMLLVSDKIFEIIRFVLINIIIIHWSTCIFFILMKIGAFKLAPFDKYTDEYLEKESVPDLILLYLVFFAKVFDIFMIAFNSAYFPEEEGLLLFVFHHVCTGCGLLLLSFGIARFTNVLVKEQITELRYRRLLNHVDAFMYSEKVPENVKPLIKSYLKVKYRGKFVDEKFILSTLPDNLRQDMHRNNCKKFISKVPLFEIMPEFVIKSLVNSFVPEIFLPNDHIMNAGDKGDCMYFISTGTVAIYSADETEIAHLDDGSYFGEMALLGTGEDRLATIVAVTICELYRLNRKDFVRTVKAYPELVRRMKEAALKRYSVLSM